MEKNEVLERLVMRRTVLAEEAAGTKDGDSIGYNQNGSSSVTFTVVFSTLVAMSGVYAFGNAVGYSSPAKGGIMEDLGLSLAEYAVFGSTMTVGGILGAIFSGKLADLVGRRAVSIGNFTNFQHHRVACNSILKALIGAIPCVLQLVGVFFIPESPRWLAKTNRTKEFEAALQCLRGQNADISQEAADIREYTDLQQMSDGGSLNLFQRKYTNPLIVGAGLMVFQQLGGLNGFSYYASVIFESAGFPSTVGSIAVAVLQTFVAALGLLFIDKSGRRPLLLLSAAGTCLGCVITGSSFFLQDFDAGKDLIATLALIGVLVFLLSFDLGMGAIPWTIVSEIYPVNIRGSAGSLVNVINWISSWIVAYSFNFLFEWNSAGTFFIFAFMGGVGIVFIAKLVPETKGQTLEEIQASMTQNLQ